MIVLSTAGACVRLNADHCANQLDSTAYCGSKHDLPYCSACESANDGCMSQRPSPGCDARDGSSSGAQSDSVASLDTTTLDTSTTATSATTTTMPMTTMGTGDSEDSSSTATDDGGSSSTGEPQAYCGNDVVDLERGETCDGATMPATMCSEVLLGGGMLGCYPPNSPQECQYDTSACDISADCGDMMITGAETCELNNLDGQTCESLSDDFIGGELRCDTMYCIYDTSQCTPCRESGESCGAGQCCTGLCVLGSCVG